jgi:S1-C subfamily serine protease
MVRTFDGIESDYEVVASDIDLDLAVIKFIKNDRLSINPISFLTNSVEINNLVFSVGNPLGIYDYLSIGFIKGFPILQSIELQRDSIEHSAILAPGSSGGALTDEYGQLIGINAWVLNEKYYAIPISDILIFLQNHGISHN